MAPARPLSVWPVSRALRLVPAALLILLLVLVTAPIWAIAFLPGVDLWATDDGTPHLLRTFALDRALDQTLAYPRWLPDLYRGYGYPVFNYYSPLTYYVGSMLHRLLGVSIYGSLQLQQALAVLAGAGGAFALAWHLFPVSAVAGRPARGVAWRRVTVGLFAAVVYAGSPYPFLVNLYLRGDLPEAAGLAILPWFLLAVHRAWVAPGSQAVPGTLVAAALGTALLLTHALSALLAVVCAALWALCLLCAAPRQRGAAGSTRPALWSAGRRGLARLAIGGLVAFGIAGFFCIPALAEGYAVQFDLVHHPFDDLRIRLGNPLGSTPASLHPRYLGARHGPIEVAWGYPYIWRGKAGQDGPVRPSLQQGLILLFAAAGAGWLVWRQRCGRDAPKPGDATAGAGLFGAGVIAGVMWFLNTTWSAPLWEHVEPLRFIQFPSRLYGPFALGLAILAAGVMARLPLGPAGALVASTALGAALVSGSLMGIPVPRSDQVQRHIDGSAIVHTEYVEDAWAGGGLTGSGEFTPRAVDIAASEVGRPRGNQIFDRLYPPASWIGSTLLVYAGQAQVLELRGSGLWREAVVEVAGEGATLAWHQLYFPGWNAYVDGRYVPIKLPPFLPEEDSALGFQLVDVPPGRHRVTLVFGTTRHRLLGNIASAATLLGVTYVLLRMARGKVALDGWGTSRHHAALAELDGRGTEPRTVAAAEQAAAAVWPAQTSGHRPQRGWWYAAAAVAAAGAALALFQLGAEAGRHTGLLWPRAAPNRLVLDVAAAVEGGTARLDAPSGARVGPDAFIDVGWLRIGPLEPNTVPPAHAGRERRWLFMHPPARATVRLRVPDRDTIFQSGIGLRPESWDTPWGDGVRFIVEVTTGDGRTHELFAHRLNPRAHTDERRWVEVRVELGRFAGQEVDLTLRTDPYEDVRYDWAGWGNPVVVSDPGIRRPANGPRPPASVAALGQG